MSTSAEGSVNGKCEARKRVFTRRAEEGGEELLQRPFEVRHRDVAVDRQPLHLVEHRRVRLVVVGAVDPARRDDAARRAVLQHVPDLHRAGVGAQDVRLPVGVRAGQVEGVHLLPAEWCQGMLSASKLCQSVSTCGPSATAYPISAKIAVTSSVTWLTGWIVPCGRCRGGSVTSSHSVFNRSSSAASSSAARRADSAELISPFSALSRGPASCRSSGVIRPSSRMARDTSPFLPTARTRTSSSVASSAAARDLAQPLVAQVVHASPLLSPARPASPARHGAQATGTCATRARAYREREKPGWDGRESTADRSSRWPLPRPRAPASPRASLSSTRPSRWRRCSPRPYTACGGSLELGPGAITLAEIDGDGRTDVLFDWSKVNCTGAATVGMSRGAGNCGMHMCAVDLYASSVYRPGAYPQGILALEFAVQPLGSEVILTTTSMGGSCPFAEVCERAWRWTGAELQAVR